MPFRDCVGHRRLLAVLARSVQRRSLPPSLIFGGPEGVGKRHIAISLAQLLNCTDLREGDGILLDACGSCPACRRIARGVHPDVVIVEPGDSGTIKVDQVRDIVDRAGYRPFEGRRRVVIVDEADALVPQAQNALLKTLEEPPAGSVFVLVTARPDSLLPTVRSRCPLLRFRPLSTEEVASVLIAGGKKEAEARAVAATADGSISQALAASAGDLLDIRDAAARVLGRLASSRDPRQRIDEAKSLLPRTSSGGASDREHLAQYVKSMAALVRDASLLEAGADPGGLANSDVRADLERLAAFGGARGPRAFEVFDEALAALEGNASAKIVADWLVLEL
jgi:DNA polymerase III subunit delta'